MNSLKNELIDSSITGAVFYGVDKWYYGETSGGLKRAAMCTAADAGAAVTKDQVTRWVLGMHPSMSASVLNETMKPALCGAFYIGLNQVSPSDFKSPMYQFLHAAGSSFVGSAATPYVRNTLRI